MGTLSVVVYGSAEIEAFSKKYAVARKPLARFLSIARAAQWASFVEVKRSFPSTDYASSTGVLIFDIGGNKFRLIATVDFEEQILVIRSVMSHKEYSREKF